MERLLSEALEEEIMSEKISSRFAIDTVPLPDRTVRVTLPRRIAFDLKSIQEIQRSVLGRLGCPECCSGFDIRFDVATHFAVDKQLKLQELAEGGIVIDG